MKKTLFVALLAVVVSTAAAQRPHPDGYLTTPQTVEDYDFIAIPPALTAPSFFNDFVYYQYGRDLRADEQVSQQALQDERQELYLVYQHSTKVLLSPETTPEILLLCERAVSDAHKANTLVKNKFQRVRPFATFKEPSLKPWEDEEEASTYSYPSGHSSRGYIFAFALCAIAPECTPTIMTRAQLYAFNRVVCGHHWKSDTDTSLLLAAATFAKVVCTDDFQEQLKKARAEYQQLVNSGATQAPGLRADEVRHQAAIYDMLGRRVQEPSASGIYIQDGRKTAVK
jgi:acid phosphatase (class A)